MVKTTGLAKWLKIKPNYNLLLQARIIPKTTHCTIPVLWPVPYACTQPYHLGNGSHGQLFRLWLGLISMA